MRAKNNEENFFERNIEHNFFREIHAPVVQLDRTLASGAKGFGFKSRQAYFFRMIF